MLPYEQMNVTNDRVVYLTAIHQPGCNCGRNACRVIQSKSYFRPQPSQCQPCWRLRCQETIVISIADAYFALEPTAAAAALGAGGLAGGVISYAVRFILEDEAIA